MEIEHSQSVLRTARIRVPQSVKGRRAEMASSNLYPPALGANV